MTAEHHEGPPKKTAAETEAGGLDPALLEILVCPLTHGPLEWDPARSELISRKAGLAFPVREGVPIMLVEEARRLDEDA